MYLKAKKLTLFKLTSNVFLSVCFCIEPIHNNLINVFQFIDFSSSCNYIIKPGAEKKTERKRIYIYIYIYIQFILC